MTGTVQSIMSETPAAPEYGSGPSMHPQLTDKRIVCKDFIAALEECHSGWWGARFTGACNQAKRELNLCLRKERVDRAARNLEISRERRAKTEATWQKLEED